MPFREDGINKPDVKQILEESELVILNTTNGDQEAGVHSVFFKEKLSGSG